MFKSLILKRQQKKMMEALGTGDTRRKFLVNLAGCIKLDVAPVSVSTSDFYMKFCKGPNPVLNISPVENLNTGLYTPMGTGLFTGPGGLIYLVLTDQGKLMSSVQPIMVYGNRKDDWSELVNLDPEGEYEARYYLTRKGSVVIYYNADDYRILTIPQQIKANLVEVMLGVYFNRPSDANIMMHTGEEQSNYELRNLLYRYYCHSLKGAMTKQTKRAEPVTELGPNLILRCIDGRTALCARIAGPYEPILTNQDALGAYPNAKALFSMPLYSPVAEQA